MSPTLFVGFLYKVQLNWEDLLKPCLFDYNKPSTLEDALAILDTQPNSGVLAGGQSLVAMLNMRLVAPSHLVDINGLAPLEEIAVDDGWLRVGALARHCDIINSQTVSETAPLISQAVHHIGHPAIRNRGTIGGSLVLADPAAELPACLIALGGKLEVDSLKGTRKIDAADFFVGSFETQLKQDEILRAVQIPVLTPGYRTEFDELARRHGDYALAGLAAHGRIDNGCAYDLRLAFFGAGAKPTLAFATARYLEGKELSEENIAEASTLIANDITPVSQPGCSEKTKLHHCRVLTKRVLQRMAA